MVKKIVGIALIAAGAVVFGLLVSSGMIFPHLVGPVILIAAGILLLAVQKKGRKHE